MRVIARGCCFVLVCLSTACVQEKNARPRGWRAMKEAPQTAREVGLLKGADEAAGPRSVGAGWTEGARTPASRTTPQDLTGMGEFQSLDLDPAAQDRFRAEADRSPYDALDSPFHRFNWNLIRNPDGSLTRLYYLRSKPGAGSYVTLLKQFVPGFSGLQLDQDYWIETNFVKDPRQTSEDSWRGGAKAANLQLPFGDVDTTDLLMIAAPPELLRRVDAFLASLLADVPQVEVEVTIVEVRLDDALDIGINTTFTRGTPEDPESGLFDSGVVNLAQNLVQGTFGSFSAIHDETVVNGLVELLQSTSQAHVLSSPKLAVLNGHRAVIDTGSDVPFFQPAFNSGGLTGITTSFKQTGIKVVVVPFILNTRTVQLDVSVEVSAVTGFLTAGVGNGAEVDNPLIARRNAFTMVNVPSGKTVMIGGLVTSDEVESVSKVPFLGDIPLLGHLFRRRSTSTQKSQVLFLVKPTILRERFRGNVLYDPGQDLEGEDG